MKILQNVIVKQVLTENSKQDLLERYERQKLQLEKECDQLRFELKKLEKAKKVQPASLQAQMKKEMNSRHEKIKLLDFQVEQLHILPLGSELKEREIQAIVNIEVGDDWDAISSKTIVVKDGVVDQIR